MTTSLYIDHQLVAPLIYSLEDIVSICVQELDYEYEKYDIRMEIYQNFVSLLNQYYRECNGEVKNQEKEIKYEDGTTPIITSLHHMNIESTGQVMQSVKQEFDITGNGLNNDNKKKGRPVKNLEAEIKLAQWILANSKKMFLKKQIDAKYQEYCGKDKKVLTIKRLTGILQKYKLFNIIIKSKNGEQIIVRQPTNKLEMQESKVKRQEEKHLQEEINEQLSPWRQFLKDPIQQINENNELYFSDHEKHDSYYYSENQMNIPIYEQLTPVNYDEKDQIQKYE